MTRHICSVCLGLLQSAFKELPTTICPFCNTGGVLRVVPP